MIAPEILMFSFPSPGAVAPLAEQAEKDGWDGLVLADSQNLQSDVYVELALAGAVTERVTLGTAVTNPVTRHPAVTASAIATLQAETQGRALLGIGRGDSSLTLIGQTPAPVSLFGDYVAQVQAFLRGEAVEVDGYASRIEWIPHTGQPKVPVDVAATGPHTIEVGARLAERVTFTLVAQPEAISAAIEAAREARRVAGLDAGGVSLGAYIVSAADPDLARARELVRANVGILARFSAEGGARAKFAPTGDRETLDRLRETYDKAQHGLRSAPQSSIISDEFVDRFAVVGPPSHCVARLRELVALGLDHLVIIGSSRDVAALEARRAKEVFANEVLPALRAT